MPLSFKDRVRRARTAIKLWPLKVIDRFFGDSWSVSTDEDAERLLREIDEYTQHIAVKKAIKEQRRAFELSRPWWERDGQVLKTCKLLPVPHRMYSPPAHTQRSLQLVFKKDIHTKVGTTHTFPLLIAEADQHTEQIERFGIVPHIVVTAELHDVIPRTHHTPLMVPWAPPDVPGTTPGDVDLDGHVMQWGISFTPDHDLDVAARVAFRYQVPIPSRFVGTYRKWSIKDLPPPPGSDLSRSSSSSTLPDDAILTPTQGSASLENMIICLDADGTGGKGKAELVDDDE